MSFNPIWQKKKNNNRFFVGINDNSVFIPQKTINKVEDLFFHRLPDDADKEDLIFIGMWKDSCVYTFPKENIEKNSLSFTSHRNLVTQFHNEPGFMHMLGRGISLFLWHRDNKYCGRCGHRTLLLEDEPGFKCQSCSAVFYPRISPAVITLIHKDDKILLARNRLFSKPVYSCIAGYVDPGENSEQAVSREIMEEVGLKVKNIRYYKSQFWPVSNSLISGFFAEYRSGTILPDGEEIVEADWFSKESLPLLPMEGSISRELIDYFLDNILQ